jgi:hypothetical protein
MPGGLLNLVSSGNENIHLNGNPSKTFFKSTYAKHTNFGLQKFRLDMEGDRDIGLTESTTFTFKIPFHADLLMDTYLCLNIPSIWSPIYYNDEVWTPYEFQWIKNLGTMMIEEVTLTIGGQIIQRVSGQYIHNMVLRDFDSSKKELYDRMTGNTPDMYDPANTLDRSGYPNVLPGDNVPEPSIRGRQVVVPLNLWFAMASKMALPLVSLEYSEVKMEIVIRPVQDLFTILDIDTHTRIRPNFSDTRYTFYRFLHPPDNIELVYGDTRTRWNADIHLISTYGFLDETERQIFRLENQRYLIKESHETIFNNIVGTKKLDLKSMGLVSDWMWYFQRTDIKDRNEWSNYSNWKYSDVVPSNTQLASETNTSLNTSTLVFYPIYDYDTNPIYITGPYSYENTKKIMTRCAIIFDGKYRENEMRSSVYEWIDKYSRTNGNSPDCVYYYSFAINSDNFQPSGAINTGKFRNIELEITTIDPILDPNAQTYNIHGPNGGLIGTNKSTWSIYKYTYDVTVIEHRYNILTISSGMASLMYAR